MVKKGYFDIQIGSSTSGRLNLILYDDEVPKTVANFCHYLQQRKVSGGGYFQSNFHRIIKGFMAQGGDFINGDGTGSTSIYGGGSQFDDENFIHTHNSRGILSMANSGPNTNGCQFFITFKPTPHLNNKHVVFGHVDLSTKESRDLLNAMENVRTGPNNNPLDNVTIVDCNVVSEEDEDNLKVPAAAAAAAASSKPNIVEDENEVELPPEEDDDEEEQDFDDEEEDLPPPKTKAEEIQQRMRKLKMKMNQARQLNKKEVLKEGERLGSVEGAEKARRRQHFEDKKQAQRQWKASNSKAIEVAKEFGVDSKYMVEQADTSIKKSMKKSEGQRRKQFSPKDYYNEEGQYNNYARNLKSLTRSTGEAVQQHGDNESNNNDSNFATTFDPINNEDGDDEQKERDGARLLGKEMKRRIDKRLKNEKKRKEMEFEQTDVSYINQRNKRFNQKIARNFDQHTAEIRQNLERGTAL